MNAQHTKGPWEYQKPFNTVKVYSANHPEGNVCFFHPDDKMADKNARLISAAPDMYEALKIALRIIEAEKEACGIYKEHTEKIRAALAKADGN